jgi:hypothetical protein
MRNSFLPLLVMVAVSVVAVISFRSPSPPGIGGPEINPGVYRQVTNHMYQVRSMTLSGSTVISQRGEPGDGPGLPAARFIIVSGDDRSPLTATLMYALAETITSQGGVAILDPLLVGDQALLPPIDCAWSLRIATLGGTPPETPAGTVDCTLRVLARTVGLPDDHPAAQRQDGAAARQAVLTLHHTSQGSASGGWPERFAADGRAMADALLADLGRGQPAMPAAAMPDWGSTMPMPVRLPELRWSAAFQRDLLRGWSGRIEGLMTIGHDGTAVASLDRLQDQLRHGGWQPQPAAGAYQVWHRDNDDGWLSIRSDAGGHDLVEWWEREHPAVLFSQWLDAAQDGVEPAIERAARLRDRDLATPTPTPEAERARAREALARYRDCPIIPADYRARAQALLATAQAAPTGSAPASAPEPAR